MAPASTPSTQAARPPIVVVLGHVDHGKTKLLDTIRKTRVAERESGGITQHIGAYQATTHNRLITFLDTPGHEAFTAIRSRGCRVADIAILVVAADESVKPQTKEAIAIIQEAGIPFVVAINKVDREGANPQKVKQDLAQESVLVEEWGGTVPAVEISAKNATGIDDLLDMVLLVADLAELPDERTAPGEGIIIESHLDKRRGFVATALITKGTVRTGDWVSVGTMVAKIRSLEDFTGVPITEAIPSQPVLITGWSETPIIGHPMHARASKEEAEEARDTNMSIAPLFQFLKETMAETPQYEKTLPILLRADVTSSLEALESALRAIRSTRVGISVLDYGVGSITDADIRTARTSHATIFGFRVSAGASVEKLAEREKVPIQTFDIIYELVNAVREAMAGLLEQEVVATAQGKLRILAVFKKEGRSCIVGGRVTSGKISRGTLLRVGDIYVGKLTQLQHNKEDAADVREGLEAGLRIDVTGAQREIGEGDVIEAYTEEKVTQVLS